MTDRSNRDQNIEANDQTTMGDNQDQLSMEDLDNVSGGTDASGADNTRGAGKQALPLGGLPGAAGKKKPFK